MKNQGRGLIQAVILMLVGAAIFSAFALAGSTGTGTGESATYSRAGGGAGSVTSVTAAAPITSTGGTTPQIGCTLATTGTAGCLNNGSVAQTISGDKTLTGTTTLTGFNFSATSNYTGTGVALNLPNATEINWDNNTTRLYANGSNGLIVGGTNSQLIAGGFVTSGNSALADVTIGPGTINLTDNSTMTIENSGLPDSSSAVAETIGSFNTYVTTGARLINFVNGLGNVEGYIDRNGVFASFAEGVTGIVTGPGTNPDAQLQNGALARGVFKITLDKNAWIAAATTQDITLGTIPAKSRITSVYADTTTAYAGLAGTITLQMGTSSGGNQLLLAKDVKTATVTQGLLAADLGASIQVLGNVQVGTAPSWSTQQVFVRLTSGTGNIGNGSATNLTTGTTTYYVTIEALP